MLITIIVLPIAAVLVINFIIAQHMENAAALKGYGKDAHVFSICFWLGLVGWVYVAALPDKIQQEQNQKIISLLEKQESGDKQ